jgi:trigger factor
MEFQLNVEETSTIRRRLHFTLPGDVVRGELDRAYRDLKKRVRLPGFRPGKVPRNLLEKQYGKQVKGEVAGRLIELSVKEAFADLDVAGRPSVEEQGEVQRGEQFTFIIGVDVRPEIEVQGYSGLELTKSSVEIGDEIIDAQIQGQLAGKARIESVTDDRPVEEGDLVLAEVKLEADGEALVDDQGTLVNSAGDQFYPGVEALLIGLKKGEDKSEEVTVGEKTALEHLAGKTCQATVKVLGIQARVLPEPAELAEELGFDDVDAMKISIREQMEKSASESARHASQVQALEKLVEINGFDVPEGMVEDHLQALLKEVKMQSAYRGEDPRGLQFSPEELEDYRGRARFAAKASLILEGVARAEKLGVDEGDVQDKIIEIAENRGQEIDAIRSYLMNDENLPRLKDLIVEEKTMGWLLDHAKFSEKESEAATE